ncbi:hypothetical protein [Streptomyces sp. FIT100]|uniref:hypothetical protein n=1 Tax=Streptomyces sp. FIT100 TaxID=2837956 RepID=UPI0022038A7F|nr:hypothetical protein KK483_11780 [Streptomyces sp. FIT100]
MFGRLVVHTVVVLAVVMTLSAAGSGRQQAAAVSVCSGRPAKTVLFATGELRIHKTRQYVCALAVARKPGARREMSVSLQPRGGHAAVDRGRFTRQAGPVTVHALNRCVRVSGAIAGHSASTGWILC